MRNELVVNHNTILSVGRVIPVKTDLPVAVTKKVMGQGAEPLPVSPPETTLPEILFMTSYPPRECGIATYSQDLIKALNNKFHHSFRLTICALESENEKHHYPDEIKFILDTDQPGEFIKMSRKINDNTDIRLVMIQHEFGFFNKNKAAFGQFLEALRKPVITVFHTVLPHPDEVLKTEVQHIADHSASILVMTRSSAKILRDDYIIPREKITVIQHGTHLVPHIDKEVLKKKHHLKGKKVLSTFGLLSSGKSIETTLLALPAIVRNNPDVLFLVIGKTHPSVVKQEGEKYRILLDEMVSTLNLQQHVRFINQFLPLPDLLEYLQLTDIYLFTSRDPHQAVSGTFSYALACGCPVISTPIPHACEVLRHNAGIIIEFGNPDQLSGKVTELLNDKSLRMQISSNGLQRMASTAWENSAIAHAMLFEKTGDNPVSLHYNLPRVRLDHVIKMTTDFGMLQFSNCNQPDMNSGYTLDDNARALVAMCQQYEMTLDESGLKYIYTYFHFIKYCIQPDGSFLNYVDEHKKFTDQNETTNLDDANGRAVWALGYLVSTGRLLPRELVKDAASAIRQALVKIRQTRSTRAMAFAVKGLYYYTTIDKSTEIVDLIHELANRLLQMYRHENEKGWHWFESYLTYANSILPEALLCAWVATADPVYRETARQSFDFLLSKTFRKNRIQVISNKTWLHRGNETFPKIPGGEQPIDVAYTIMALGKFYEVFGDAEYYKKMIEAFNWFLGNNSLHQVIYNPCTGGCYDGLEEKNVNLNQGAESTVSYLMARLTVEKLMENTRCDKSVKDRSPDSVVTGFFSIPGLSS